MKRLVMKPEAWPCTLATCRPGHFLFDNKYVGFKNEYYTDKGAIEAYNEAGEFFCPEGDRNLAIVLPMEPVWEEYIDGSYKGKTAKEWCDIACRTISALSSPIGRKARDVGVDDVDEDALLAAYRDHEYMNLKGCRKFLQHYLQLIVRAKPEQREEEYFANKNSGSKAGSS